MSGIYIKGMEMPETCYECPCGDNEFYECMATKDRNSYHHDEYGYPDGERQEWCPLIPVPDHGDLIDREPFIDFIKTHWDSADQWFVDQLEARPTIISAEEETT